MGPQIPAFNNLISAEDEPNLSSIFMAEALSPISTNFSAEQQRPQYAI